MTWESDKYQRGTEDINPEEAFNSNIVCYRPNGTTPMRVVSMRSDDYGNKLYTTQYLDQNGEYEAKLKSVKVAILKSEYKHEEENMTTIYEIKGQEKETYGTKVGVKSDGKWLMEVKGSGDILAVDRKDLEEVLPYTVSVKFTQGGGYSTYDYITEKDSVEVGDFVFIEDSSGLAVVTAIDVKSKKATKRLIGSVLKGTRIE